MGVRRSLKAICETLQAGHRKGDDTPERTFNRLLTKHINVKSYLMADIYERGLDKCHIRPRLLAPTVSEYLLMAMCVPGENIVTEFN